MVTLPLTLVVTIVAIVVIVLDAPGVPIHVSTRVGRGGRPFRLLKLRTMRLGTAGQGPITVKDDVRLTRAGRVLRRSRIDELPQLVNVIRGEMSFVGPRPEDPAFVDAYSSSDRIVLSVHPGIAGLAQLAFHNEAHRVDPLDPAGSYRRATPPPEPRAICGFCRARDG